MTRGGRGGCDRRGCDSDAEHVVEFDGQDDLRACWRHAKKAYKTEDAAECMAPIEEDRADAVLLTDGGVDRRVISSPEGNEAGVAVVRHPDPAPKTTEYTVEQLWPDGEAEPVYVGDEEAVLELISTLAEVVADAE